VIEVTVIDTPSLGNRSYLASDGRVAVVIDPPRDIDRVLAAAAALGVRITHVLETHLHNDYLTGGLALARQAGARYCVNAADRVAFDRESVRDAELIEVGEMAVRVVATPGHTFTHLSYVLSDANATMPAGVFTGGSLLCGSTGRPDLLGPAHTRALACAQHASARNLACLLPESTPVYPTHGFGSFCAATPANGDSSTIGAELRRNPALLLGAEQFVSATLALLDAYPGYYAHMSPANAAGPAAADLAAPPPVDPEQVAKRVATGEWVVDLRGRRAFAAGHVPGTFGFELSDSFATYLGWLIPWGTPLTVLADGEADVAAAQRQLARIGIDVAGAVIGPPELAADGQSLASYPVSDFAGLAATWSREPLAVVDVRRWSEWRAGHIDGAIGVPLHELPARLAELPDRPIWVHCQAGYRAAIAASLLRAADREVTAIDDDLARAPEAGLTLIKPRS
jgi:hydroxyacylglutathione hydrolase